MADVGAFFVDIEIEAHSARGRVVTVPHVLVDTGAEGTWIPGDVLESLGVVPEARERYQMADGRVLERDVGFAIIRLEGKITTDDVVFAQPGDLTLLGARSLEGLNLRVDARTKRLIPAGPIVTAAT
jgi:clan AA aspartic protease